ncbi:MAG: YceI family protein [Myxococcales bacterium]|nr:YceI family protein [Myxococcales bacterium]
MRDLRDARPLLLLLVSACAVAPLPRRGDVLAVEPGDAGVTSTQPADAAARPDVEATAHDAGVMSAREAEVVTTRDAGTNSPRDAGTLTSRDARVVSARDAGLTTARAGVGGRAVAPADAGVSTTFDAGLAIATTAELPVDAGRAVDPIRTWAQQGAGTATFDGTGPAGLKVRGVAPASVVDDGRALTVSLSILDIDTDNSVRNRHLKEDAQADVFPLVSLVVPLTELKTLSETAASTRGTATGTFALHGKSKAVTFTWSATCKAGVCAVTGSAPLSLTDFGIKVRSYLGVTVKPDLTVGASFTIKR